MPTFGRNEIDLAIARVAQALDAAKDRLTELDQAMGDGDLGITAGKIAAALRERGGAGADGDLGTYVAQTGIDINRAAPSSFGTLLATAVMRAGKAVKGRSSLDLADLATMLEAADQGLQERGKAKPGDKTIIDAVHPAAVAAREAVDAGADASEMAAAVVRAAVEGRDAVTALRSKVGRAGWVGERTEGVVDPGCEAGVWMLRAIAGIEAATA